MNKWVIIIFIFLFSVSLRLWNINEMGRTWDEAEYVEPGYKYIELLKKGDIDNSYFYTTYNHPPLVKYLYGISAHFDVAKYLPNGEVILKYDLIYSRVLSAIFFSLGVAMVVLIGWKIFSPSVGIFSGIILAMLPFSLGLSQLVTAESIKIFIYSLAIYAYILLIEKFTWRKVLIAGIVTGIALQVKQSNFLLVPILAGMFFLQYKDLKTRAKNVFVKNRIKSIIYICLISVTVFILIWPQLLFHFKEIYAIHSELWDVQFSSKIWQITLSPPEVFFGRLMLTPIFYYVVYFFITIPLLILILFFVGVKGIFKKKNIYLYSILLWFLMPFSLSIYSWRQHGLRYIIEIYPALAIISAVGFETLIKKLTKNRLYEFLLFLPVVVYLLVSLWFIKPYYLDYFNELIGGVNTVYKYNLFQTGWWGQGLGEAGLYLGKNAPQGSRVGLAISPEHVFLRFDSLRYSNWSANNEYDYVVVNNYHIIRDGFDDSMIKKKYKPVFFVKADKAVLITVYKLK
ncbi:MAG: glycosyltransferase family 39 protein [Candidatus Levybacteria bacterium]|nr:glycosyltransferase family 39 protein [Candidatus Levybacteria bacterium]